MKIEFTVFKWSSNSIMETPSQMETLYSIKNDKVNEAFWFRILTNICMLNSKEGQGWSFTLIIILWTSFKELQVLQTHTTKINTTLVIMFVNIFKHFSKNVFMLEIKLLMWFNLFILHRWWCIDPHLSIRVIYYGRRNCKKKPNPQFHNLKRFAWRGFATFEGENLDKIKKHMKATEVFLMERCCISLIFF
jgi:hypothetical protein